MGKEPGRASDWDGEIASLFKIPKKPFSTQIEAAAELLAVLETRGFFHFAYHDEKGWVSRFSRKGRSDWPEEAIGSAGNTMPEAVAKAALKIGNLLRLEGEERR